MNSIIVRWASGILGGLLIAFVCYGAYRFYFDKPIPIINNTVVQAGGKIDVKQAEQPKTGVSGHLMTGIYGSRSEIGITAGWIW